MNDVGTLGRFYTSPVGRHVQKNLMESVDTFWPSLQGLSLLGYGYPLPYFESYRHDALFTSIAFPGFLGGEIGPPPPASNTALLAEGAALPFLAQSFDRIMLVHGLETEASPLDVLREMNRILAPEGRVIVIIPRFLSPWKLDGRTPFSSGRAFSHNTLHGLVWKAGFEPLRRTCALYAPPFAFKGGDWGKHERLWQRFCPFLGGVLIMEAMKRKPSRHPPLPQLVPALVPKMI